MRLSIADQQQLLRLAHDTIAYGIKHQKIMPIEINNFPAHLRENAATFVTLHSKQQLRGCIGTLQAYRPLIIDLMHNAYAAAFRDPRFMPLTAHELAQITLDISVLSQPEKISFINEADLIRQLRPHVDGLILTDGDACGTFLPSVWKELPDPKKFWQHLKHKAGLPINYWSDTLVVERYTVTMIK